MQDFKREFDRYIVIKWEDVGCLTADEQQQLIDFSRRVTSANFSRTGRPWECLVLESHWPEYERAWGMIESRVTGKPTRPNCIGKDGDQLPHWALARSNGTLQAGLQLFTKNPRRCGNAFITVISYDHTMSPPGTRFEVITDAGNEMVLTDNEVDELFERGDYISATNEVPGVMAQRGRADDVTPAKLPRPSGHGPVAWFLAAVDDAREQGHENMILPDGLGNLIAEHINQLETQVERYQRIENTTSIDIDASGISPETVEQFKRLSGHVLSNMQQAMTQLNPGDAAVMRRSPRTGDAKKSLPLGAKGTNYHRVTATWMGEGDWIEIKFSALSTEDVYEADVCQASSLAVILAKEFPGTEVVVALVGESQERWRSMIVQQIVLSSDVEVKHALGDWSRIKVVYGSPKKESKNAG